MNKPTATTRRAVYATIKVAPSATMSLQDRIDACNKMSLDELRKAWKRGFCEGMGLDSYFGS